jgi:hypothetical protein
MLFTKKLLAFKKLQAFKKPHKSKTTLDASKAQLAARKASLWLVALMLLQASAVNAIDLQPNDARPPPPGITTLQVSYQHLERGDSYKSGAKVATDGRISSDIYFWRAGHSFELNSMPAYVYLAVPTGAVHPQKSLAALGGDAGVGDTTLLLALWPYNNPETKTYLGVAAYLVLPTGSYDKNRYFNIGENVYKTALQAAYQQPIADKLNLMVALDALWAGDNSEFLYRGQQTKLEQNVQYNTQANVVYDLSPRYDIAASYYYTLGAESTINGIDQDNAKDLQRYQVFLNAKYSIGRLSLQYGSDIKTENGYFEGHRLIVRYMKAF